MLGRHWIWDGLIQSGRFRLRWDVRSVLYWYINILIFSNVIYDLNIFSIVHLNRISIKLSYESICFTIFHFSILRHNPIYISTPGIFFRRRIFRYDTCELEISIWKKILIWISTYFHLFPIVDLFFRTLSMSGFFGRRFSQMGIINSLHGYSSGTRLFFISKMKIIKKYIAPQLGTNKPFVKQCQRNIAGGLLFMNT